MSGYAAGSLAAAGLQVAKTCCNASHRSDTAILGEGVSDSYLSHLRAVGVSYSFRWKWGGKARCRDAGAARTLWGRTSSA